MLDHYLDELRMMVDEKLDSQLDLYANEARADSDAMEEADYDLQNPHDLIDLVLKNVEDTEFMDSFVTVLQKLLLVSSDEYVGTVRNIHNNSFCHSISESKIFCLRIVFKL